MCDEVNHNSAKKRSGRTLSRIPLTRADLISDSAAALQTRLGLILENKWQYKRMLSLRRRRAQKLLDIFESILASDNLTETFRRNAIVAMQRLSKTSGLYPYSYELKGVKINGNPIVAGGFGDVYKGYYNGRLVCVKMIRIYQTSSTEQFMAQFTKEAILWSHLSHPNILPFYGLCKINSRPCFVSPWISNGDVRSYLSEHPEADRNLLLRDITEGLGHLHFYDVIHGDLKGPNVLVNGVGRAYLADFGLSSVSGPNILHWTSHSRPESRGGSTRWQAPELFDGSSDQAPNTKASDVYSWGCVCYEVMTGNLPLYEYARDSAVICAVINQKRRPSKPASDSDAWGPGRLTEALWDLMTQCWATDPKERPLTSELLPILWRMSPTVDNRRYIDPEEIHAPRFRASGRHQRLTVHDLEELIFKDDDPTDAKNATSYSDGCIQIAPRSRPIESLPPGPQFSFLL